MLNENSAFKRETTLTARTEGELSLSEELFPLASEQLLLEKFSKTRIQHNLLTQSHCYWNFSNSSHNLHDNSVKPTQFSTYEKLSNFGFKSYKIPDMGFPYQDLLIQYLTLITI